MISARIFTNFEIVVRKLFEFGTVKFVVWDRLKFIYVIVNSLNASELGLIINPQI